MATISFDLPNPIRDHLADEWSDLGQAAKEALAIESYRAGKLSIGMVARLLGFETRFEAEAWLGARGVNWNYSIKDFEQDCATLDTLFGERR